MRGLNYWRKLIAMSLIAVQWSFVFIGAMSTNVRAANFGDSFSIQIGLQDIWRPAPVADLDAVHGDEGKALLIWTAPDENNDIFTDKFPVASYSVKIATFSIDSLAADTTAWWNAAGDTAGEPGPQSPGSQQSMLLSGLAPGATYFFAIRSLDDISLLSPIDAKASAPGQQASAVILDTAPIAPANLTVAPGDGRVTLGWNAVSAADLWYYRVHIDSTPPYDFGDQFLISVASASTSFIHTGLTPGTTYSYSVTAVDMGAPDYAGYALESQWSNVVSTIIYRIPLVPTGFKASGVFTSSMAVSWNASAGAALYTLEVSTAADFTGALIVPTVNISAVLETLSADTTYYLHVKASNTAGASAFSSPVSTPTLANAPVAKAFNNATTSGFSVNWQLEGNPAWTSYRVEISSAMDFAFLTRTADVSGSSVSFVSLAPDATYYARVRAVNVAQTSTQWVNLGGVITAGYVLAISADKLPNVWYAALPTSFNAQGADHYHYKIASSASDLPSTTDPVFLGAPLNLNLSEGIRYFNVRGEGPTDNLVGNAAYGPLETDTIPPLLTEIRAQRNASDITPVLSGAPSDAQLPRFVWDVPASVAPISGYSYTVSLDPASEPAEAVNTTLNFLDYAVPSAGTYYVKVKALDGAGNWSPWASFSYVLNFPQTSVIPEGNYFNPRLGGQMTVRYDINQPGRVKIRLFTLRGELVKTLVDAQMQAGHYTVPWAGLNSSGEMVATGVYLLHVKAPGYERTFKCIVAK